MEPITLLDMPTTQLRILNLKTKSGTSDCAGPSSAARPGHAGEDAFAIAILRLGMASRRFACIQPRVVTDLDRLFSIRTFDSGLFNLDQTQHVEVLLHLPDTKPASTDYRAERPR